MWPIFIRKYLCKKLFGRKYFTLKAKSKYNLHIYKSITNENKRLEKHFTKKSILSEKCCLRKLICRKTIHKKLILLEKLTIPNTNRQH